ncbi:acid phosphatase [Desulfotalea psychrophila]|uniref:Acid phosphatase n=1 Tax=Desulfotalea psychrophila (strain LSv54 / DSM 12343) TaxID=177439 RepID=Q6AKN1_DESPS|nr:phosphatase PAP2 family protein [Desulfotalea psychrophila]CAG37094.1 probable acid phosphatase [Desulfotalea psychrophila LSv54]
MMGKIKIGLVLVCVALLAGCAGVKEQNALQAVPEIRPGFLQGYLPVDMLPNSLTLIPPPPAEGSTAFALDREVNRQSHALQGTARWNLAKRDARLKFPQAAETFSCALGLPISEAETPHLYMLLRRTIADAILSTTKAKNHYRRTRPFVLNGEPTCTPTKEAHMKKSGSFPSGHTAIGWAWALILVEVAPEQTDAILARGWAFGQSRIICNVHWQSDVLMGQVMGAAAVAKLHSDPAFLAEIEAAKAEVQALRAKALPLTVDCKGEAAALSENLPLASWPANR